MAQDRRYWFAAKRYGWGWGMPTAWQGWVVLTGFFVLNFSGFIVLAVNDQNFGAAIAWVVILTVALFVICWRTGEPPRWRWGGKE